MVASWAARRDLPIPAGPRTVRRRQRRSRMVWSIGVLEVLELVLAADEGLVEAAGDAGGGRVDLVDAASFGLFARALGGEALEGADGDGVLDQRIGRLADQDVPGPGGLLEAFGEHDGLAGDEGLAAAGVAGDDLAGVDADPHLQVEPERCSSSSFSRSSRSCIVGGAAHGPEGVVLVHCGHAEDGHDLVADELLDRAAVRLDRGLHLLEVPRHHLPQRLRVDPLGQPGRVHHVAEQHRHRLPQLTRECRHRTSLGGPGALSSRRGTGA